MRRPRRRLGVCPCGHVHQKRPYAAERAWRQTWAKLLTHIRYGDIRPAASLVMVRHPHVAGAGVLGPALVRALGENA